MIKRGPKPVTYKRHFFRGRWIIYKFVEGWDTGHTFTDGENSRSFNHTAYTREEAWEKYKQELSTPNT
jgi:hypothetical protein